MNRYLAAAIIAGLISASALAYGAYVRADFSNNLRESFREAKAEGAPNLSNVDVDSMKLADFGIELSRKDLRRIQLADFIQGGWMVWSPLLFAICLGIAYLGTRKSNELRPSQPPGTQE
jgi:hypothetical protein